MKEPDKWCIKITPENREAIEKWRTANVTLSGYGYCVNKTSFDSSIGYWYPNKPEGYTEISFEEFKVYTSKPKDLTGRYVKCLIDGAQGTKCKAGEIYKLVSLDDIVETQVYKLEDGFSLCISPTTSNKWELLPEDYSDNKPLKQAVHCKTQEEWDFVSEKLGYKWLDAKWDNYKSDSIITLHTRGCSGVGSNTYQILSFQEWCDLNGYKMEKSKQEILKEFAEKYPPGTKVKSPDGIEFIISTTHKHKGENNDFLQSSPYYTGLRGEVLAVKENSCIGEYLYKDGKYAEIIKDAPKFEVGDYVVLQYSSAKEIGYNTTSNNTRLKAGHIDKIANFRDGQTWSENSKIRWVGLKSDPYNGVIEILLRHATPDEINNHLISIGQIQQYLPGNQEFEVGDWVVVLEEDGFYINSEKCPQKLIGVGGYGLPYRLLFKDGHTNSYEKIRHATEKEMQEYFRKNDDLLKKEIEAKTNEYSNEILDRMKGETPKPSYHLLSVDDEELPMVNIIKTNTVKQLLNND